MSDDFRLALIWLLGGTIASFAALAWLPAVFIDGEVLLTGHDSFYHGRRILDAVQAPLALLQFDPRIEAPEGAWVPWPWGFDMAMAALARAVVAIAPVDDPLRVLVYVPPLWAFINAALVLAVARALRLGFTFSCVALLCFAFAPITQSIHGAGRIDHHFAEQTAVLAALLTGLLWAERTTSKARALALGAVLGCATTVHNGLFLLQLPLLAALGREWVARRAAPVGRTANIDGGSVWAIGLMLVGSQVICALPSAPFRHGFFAYELLSWFHVYVAFGTATMLVLLTYTRPSARSAIAIALVAVALVGPIAAELRSGIEFVSVGLDALRDMPEARSLVDVFMAGPAGWWLAAEEYSALVWLAPITAVACAARFSKHTDLRHYYFDAFVLFGLAMLAAQQRFHPYGSFALYLPALAWAQSRFDTLPSRWVIAGVSVVATLAYLPVLPSLAKSAVPAFDFDYVITRPIYRPLARACAERQGIVLAIHNDGHYIRFHTECSVIANNLILTRSSRAKIAEVKRLFSMSAAQLRTAAPCVRYVLARRKDNILDTSNDIRAITRANAGLRAELLLNDTAPLGFRPLFELRTKNYSTPDLPVARLFEIEGGGDADACRIDSRY